MTKSAQSKRDKYLLKRYGITDTEYQTMLAEQNGKCKICGKEPTGRPLHVDHDHSLRYCKLRTTQPFKGEWVSSTDPLDDGSKICVWEVRPTRLEAIQAVRLQLKREAVRGIICYQCNTTLKWARDNPQILRNAAQYLEDYQQQLTQGGQSARQA